MVRIVHGTNSPRYEQSKVRIVREPRAVTLVVKIRQMAPLCEIKLLNLV